MANFKIKILVFVSIVFLAGNNLFSQTTDEIKADLFYKISDKLIFIGDASKISYRIGTYGCSDDFVKALNYFKPKGIFSDRKYEIFTFNANSSPSEFDFIIIDQSKNSELNSLYAKLENATSSGTSVALFTNNWTDKDRVIFNFVVENNSDIVSFEYNLENLTNFNVSATQEIAELNGTDLGARKMLDKTRKELIQAEEELKKKEQDLAKTIQELHEQQAKIDAQKSQISDQQKMIEEKQLEIIRQQSNLQNLIAQMHETKQRLIYQQQSIAQKERELRKTQQEIFDFQIRIDEMQESFLEQSKIIEQKTKELDSTTAQLDVVINQIEEKKKELGNLNNIVKIQRFALIAFAFLLGIIVLLAVWIFRNYRKMKQQNYTLEQQKNEIAAQAEELEKANLELEKLSIVASKTSNAVSILDKNGKFEWLNAGFTKMYGYTLQLLRNELDENIDNNNLYKGIAETFNKVITTKQSYYFEHESITRSSEKVWIQTAITPIVNYDGELKQIVFVDSDISIIKEAEQQIAKQNKDIKNSILYASRIQKATLPSTRILLSYLPDSFILFLPRDIVSGDFYWSSKIGNKIFFAAADCTGHGVPGAFMSMLGITLINEVVAMIPPEELQPNILLNNLRTKLITALRQSDEEGSNKDGIAISLCMIEEGSNILQFSGAENEMILVRNGEVIDYFADDMLIGLEAKKSDSFTNNIIEYQQNDMVYLFSDGYVDQFGGAGPRRKKFLIKRLRDLFSEISTQSTAEQRDVLLQTHLDWKGENNQLDDIIIMGVKL